MTNDTQLHTSSTATVSQRRLGQFKWLISESFQNASWLVRLNQPEQLLQTPAKPLKQAVVSGREVVCVRMDDSAIADVVVKRFTPRGFVEIIKWSWRSSPAYRAFYLARQIAALDFFTAEPIAAGERRVLGFLRESFLLTKLIPDATPLHLFNAHCADRQRRIGVVRKLAKLYAAMHDAGFFHHDPSQANFLVVPQMDGDVIALIDLDGLRWQRRKISLTAAMRDLRRFLLRGRIPRRERAWFITVYARSRKTHVNISQLIQIIGPLPSRATFPHCALNENSLPEANDASSQLASSSFTNT